MRAMRPPMEIAAGSLAGRNYPRQSYGNHGLHGMRGRKNISDPDLALRSAAAAMKRLLPLIAAAASRAAERGLCAYIQRNFMEQTNSSLATNRSQ